MSSACTGVLHKGGPAPTWPVSQAPVPAALLPVEQGRVLAVPEGHGSEVDRTGCPLTINPLPSEVHCAASVQTQTCPSLWSGSMQGRGTKGLPSPGPGRNFLLSFQVKEGCPLSDQPLLLPAAQAGKAQAPLGTRQSVPSLGTSRALAPGLGRAVGIIWDLGLQRGLVSSAAWPQVLEDPRRPDC